MGYRALALCSCSSLQGALPKKTSFERKVSQKNKSGKLVVSSASQIQLSNRGRYPHLLVHRVDSGTIWLQTITRKTQTYQVDSCCYFEGFSNAQMTDPTLHIPWLLREKLTSHEVDPCCHFIGISNANETEPALPIPLGYRVGAGTL